MFQQFLHLNIKSTVGLLLIILGIALSSLVNYFTLGPFTSTTGRVDGAELKLASQNSQILVEYNFSAGGKEYEGSERVPVSYRKDFLLGAKVRVIYSVINPWLSTIFDAPKPSPLFLLTGGMVLVGILVSFGRFGS